MTIGGVYFGGYQNWLLKELAEKKAKNPLFSLRAFAKSLGISPSVLSEVLNRKRHLSKRSALRIAEHFSLSPEECGQLINEIRTGGMSPQEEKVLELENDSFKLISDWYYFVIIDLCELKPQKADPRWIAARLGISEIEARDAIERLVRLGHLAVENGKLVRKSAGLLSTTKNIPSGAIRKYHKQNLKLAEVSIDRDPLELRDFGSITMPIDPARISEAREKIIKFKRDMKRFLHQGNPREVYTLAVQLFPVTQSPRGKS